MSLKLSFSKSKLIFVKHNVEKTFIKIRQKYWIIYLSYNSLTQYL